MKSREREKEIRQEKGKENGSKQLTTLTGTHAHTQLGTVILNIQHTHIDRKKQRNIHHFLVKPFSAASFLICFKRLS
jgi:isoprenylcysteine carboxyl methyltransferase (ICMT) family protein YpbQ